MEQFKYQIYDYSKVGIPKRKKILCDKNNIILVYYSELNDIDYDNYIGDFFNNIEDLKFFLYDTANKKK